MTGRQMPRSDRIRELLEEDGSVEAHRRLAMTAVRTKPHRCMFNLGGICTQTPQNGHFIQAGLLRKIARGGKLVQFYPVPTGNFEDFISSPLPPWAVAPKEAANWTFLCQIHEGFFWEMENPRPDWFNRMHIAKLAYRSMLANNYLKEWMSLVCEELNIPGGVDVHEEQLRLAIPLETAIKRALSEDGYEGLRHKIVPINSRPVIATTGVIIDKNYASSIFGPYGETLVSFSSTPIVLTILPDDRQQMLLLTYTEEDYLNVQAFLTKIGLVDNSVNTAELSKKVLEEMEYIEIAQRQWESFDSQKQDDILTHFVRSTLTAPIDFDTPASRLDLFSS